MMSFVHIPRTGGTALLGVFRQWYGNRLFAYYNEKLFSGDDYDMVFGHKHFNDSEYILFLREPYEQQLSYYNYTSQYVDMPDIDEYFKHEASTMLRFLPPINKIKFVGIYERYDDDVRLLADFLGKRYIKTKKVNASKYRHTPSDVAIEMFKKNNEYIYELYNSYL